jgi:ubiquinone biosynthesis accessory factor UbiJ
LRWLRLSNIVVGSICLQDLRPRIPADAVGSKPGILGQFRRRPVGLQWLAAYNPRMLQNLNALLLPALTDRLVLVVNHVLAAEPQATARLLPHQGRVLRLEVASLPRLLQPAPELAFEVTPAGLMAATAAGASADLRVRIDAANPAALALRALTGEPPAVAIEGDAQLAADIDWLLKNLRWDVEADLERLFGPVVAHELYKLGASLARGLRAAGTQAAAVAGRARAR